MSLIAELTKLQDRRDELQREIDAIEKELAQVASIVGVKRVGRPATASIQPSEPIGERPKQKRAGNGENSRNVLNWLRQQASAKTVRQISEGTYITYHSVQSALMRIEGGVIRRGHRYGISAAQFDNMPELEDESQSSHDAESASMWPGVQSLNGATATLSAATTTGSTQQVATTQAPSESPDSVAAVKRSEVA
jgi:hypothetical protein